MQLLWLRKTRSFYTAMQKLKKKKFEKGTENHRKIENQNYESEDSEEDEGNQVNGSCSLINIKLK